MWKILVIQHAPTEGPGTLGEFLRMQGIVADPLRVYAGERIPRSVRKYHGIISLGGPMSVHDEERYPFLADELNLLRKAIDGNLPVLGICLGAQMIARACDAAVFRAPRSEMGWRTVAMTAKGHHDIIFHGLPGEIPVIQYHEDTFDLPWEGDLLATSRECRNQAFRINNAYGFQFHVEADRTMIADWFRDHRECGQWVRRYEETEKPFRFMADKIYSNFLDLLEICRGFGT